MLAITINIYLVFIFSMSKYTLSKYILVKLDEEVETKDNGRWMRANHTKEARGRIYHGMIGTERPYQLGLFQNPKVTKWTLPPGCGATLISDNCALTAAACVTRQIAPKRFLYERILLVGGSIFWNKALHSDVQTLEFPSKGNVFIHEKWLNQRYNGYDIAVIKFPAGKRFVINQKLNFITMNDNIQMFEYQMLEGRFATISGWGITQENTQPQTLMVVTNPILKTDVKAPGIVVDKLQMLQMSQEGGRGACKGDVGGPATVMGDDGKDTLVGIIEGTIQDCGEPTDYTMLTSVYENVDWIKKTMNNN